jgi:RNase H-like domain found in reverse transcriptase
MIFIAFLYQINIYSRTESGKQKMLEDLGFEICKESENYTPYMLPGVAPGKQTPQVIDFLRDPELLKIYDELNTLDTSLTMTEKIQYINKNFTLHIKPISFHSKSFSPAQVTGYATMEKEFLGLMLSVANFRDYMMSVPITYILTDSQPVCWALRHREDNLKLSRWMLKLFEYNINFVVTHIHGEKNSVSDFLSRVYYVPDQKVKKDKTKNSFSTKWGCHVTSPFKVFEVLTKEDILAGFSEDCVIPCFAPLLCHLNVNTFLYEKPKIEGNRLVLELTRRYQAMKY